MSDQQPADFSTYGASGEDQDRARLSRRTLLKRAAVLGLSASAVSAFLAACGGGGTATTGTGASTAPSAAPSTGASTRPSASASAAPSTAASAAPSTAASAAPSTAATASRPSTATSGTGAATATRSSTPATGGGSYQYTLQSAPPVPNAAAAKQFSGTTLTYYGEGTGLGGELMKAISARFTQDTGINIKIVANPPSATDYYSTIQRFFQAQSPDVDALMIDVIWPAAFAQHLVDLSPKMGDQAKKAFPSIIENNTVDGKLVGAPFFGDFGMLFYRKDLLQKYSVAVPKTWDELDAACKKIVDGEKAANPNIFGFAFQGNAYEGLTCNGLEWFASSGAGRFIEGGKVTINSDAGAAILNKAKGWVGTISPKGVTSYQEDEAVQNFTGGNAVFARNWPYMYELAQQAEKTKDKFDVAPLPVTGSNKPVGTVGGWQVAVSKYSKNVDAAIEWTRYITSEEIVKYRGILGSYVPLFQSVADDPIVQVKQPYLKNLADVQRVTRPSLDLGENYNQGSTIIFQALNATLNGQDAKAQLTQAQSQLERLVRRR